MRLICRMGEGVDSAITDIIAHFAVENMKMQKDLDCSMNFVVFYKKIGLRRERKPKFL